MSDEHLFRAYGGALVTVEGEVTDRTINPMDGSVTVTVKVKVTIRDNADFSAKGFGQLRTLVPGSLRDIYVAGGTLQDEKYARSKKHADYWHTITFTSTYKLVLP